MKFIFEHVVIDFLKSSWYNFIISKYCSWIFNFSRTSWVNLSFTKYKDKQACFNVFIWISEISVNYMTEMLSLRLYGTVCTQVRFCCWCLVFSITTMLLWVLDRPHYDKDDVGAGWTSLHRKANKCWLYWPCPTQHRYVSC